MPRQRPSGNLSDSSTLANRTNTAQSRQAKDKPMVNQFDQLMQDTVRVRYAMDYKLDKKTTTKAEELLREFFNAIGERRGVSQTFCLKFSSFKVIQMLHSFIQVDSNHSLFEDY